MNWLEFMKSAMGHVFGKLLERPNQVIGSISGVRWLKRKLLGVPDLKIPANGFDYRASVPIISREELVNEYRHTELAAEADSFVLYRIIGNDLQPRHVKGQSRENLRFILENEPRLDNCKKRFVVNRIVDPDEEACIIGLLENAGFEYIHIPFVWNEYQTVPWDIAGVPAEYAPHGERFRLLSADRQGRILMRIYRHKNNYVINNNGARNAALREGRRIAKWVLPWDGNCFLTQSGWSEIVRAVKEHPEIPCYIVPMARITNNQDLLNPEFRPSAAEEPQIMFRRDTELEFDPEYFYGRRPKVELFWRLGVPGNWDTWPVEPWDLPCPAYAEKAGSFDHAGWVARLFSGNAHLEVSGGKATLMERGRARQEAICAMLDQLDKRELEHRGNLGSNIFVDSDKYTPGELEHNLREQLHTAAREALERGSFSVVDKTSLPPSGDLHDYWHPAPYYWPNPIPIRGLPYLPRDGRRVPGTRLYEPLSEKYDRTRLQRLFDGALITALAFREFGDEKFAVHGAGLIRRWFVNPGTAMNPHLEYAQVRKGWNGNRGNGRGIIEFKDMYYFLDAIRIIEAAGVLSADERREFRAWLGRYLTWLVESPQGQSERSAQNNHGTCYDLQVASIAMFLGEYDLLRRTLISSRFRLVEQFDAQGRQPHEMNRSLTAHYCCFNLQNWIHLAELGEAAGEDLWSFEGPQGQSLQKAMLWLLRHMGTPWPYKQIERFDHERFFPIYYAYCKQFGQPTGVNAKVPQVANLKPLFYPHDGIRPFWQVPTYLSSNNDKA